MMFSFALTAEATTLGIWKPDDGEVLNFTVTRNGNPFGYHKVEFSVSGDQTTVRNDIELKAGLGPVRLFYYRHKSTETWQDDQLVWLTGETQKDGDKLKVSVRDIGDELSIDGSGYSGTASDDLIPLSHWNIEQIRSQTLLSSEDGKVIPVEVEPLGTETLNVSGKEIEAERFRLTSALSVDLWYDETGRWVKARFEARGQTIDYVLTSDPA